MRFLHILAVLAAAPIAAATAQIGRLPVLAALPATGGGCQPSPPVNDELRRAGITRIVGFNSESPSRLVSVGVDAARRPLTLLVLTSVPAGGRRRVGEGVTVFFTPSGAALRGSRTYTTSGTPSSLSEDRRSGLLPGDTAAAFALAQAVVQRCAR